MTELKSKWWVSPQHWRQKQTKRGLCFRICYFWNTETSAAFVASILLFLSQPNSVKEFITFSVLIVSIFVIISLIRFANFEIYEMAKSGKELNCICSWFVQYNTRRCIRFVILLFSLFNESSWWLSGCVNRLADFQRKYIFNYTNKCEIVVIELFILLVNETAMCVLVIQLWISTVERKINFWLFTEKNWRRRWWWNSINLLYGRTSWAPMTYKETKTFSLLEHRSSTFRCWHSHVIDVKLIKQKKKVIFVKCRCQICRLQHGLVWFDRRAHTHAVRNQLFAETNETEWKRKTCFVHLTALTWTSYRLISLFVSFDLSHAQKCATNWFLSI